MKQFEHKEGKKAELVPFMQYYPTYSSMDKQQKEWYFYWRSQVRKGIYLDTDLSYIFVHVYELLSGYGMNNADDGYKQLLELWKNYRKEYPKLDGYLFEWIFDFCQLYNLDFEMPGWTDLSLPYQPEIKNVKKLYTRSYLICRKHCIIFYGKKQPRTGEQNDYSGGKNIIRDSRFDYFQRDLYGIFQKNDILFEKFLDLCYTVPMEIYAVKRRTKRLCENLMRIWETSVKATHTFLSDEERAKIGLYVPQAIKSIRHDP